MFVSTIFLSPNAAGVLIIVPMLPWSCTSSNTVMNSGRAIEVLFIDAKTMFGIT